MISKNQLIDAFVGVLKKKEKEGYQTDKLVKELESLKEPICPLTTTL